ncbi:ABC transporter ATP-binding protein [Pseudoroseomonas cervicalis]|uniref:ABC transporter ATP-binding protein n=1 Tax=Teichococcus cervicalis TaxID=204525 RepID=UPI002789041E|nr:ABC transporter ATP-binding protein [Pseudoroseomonas cervicalis]MDQ1078511.1 putative spermidine/putrescine transport system ATP-binding protein [Pseudoroseomonas cervicalis]
MPGLDLSLRGLGKRYGGQEVLRDVSLEVPEGSFLTLLGPSGSGKTTLLMAIAGFVAPDAGRVLLGGRDITALPPEQRDFGMVFQGYALFPHMTVAENVAFPLRARGLGRAAQAEKVRGALDLVQLSRFADRRPAELSGGQQQRVALARALVFDPALLLLDEPLSALDRQLRGELQAELRALQRRIGRSFVNVTHDQEEALGLSDRIAILNQGVLVQQGSPAELYDAPRTRFVAGFLGRTNFLRGVVTAPGEVACGETLLRVARAPFAGPVLLSLRPERIRLLAPGEAADNILAARIEAATYLGGSAALRLHSPLGPLQVVRQGGGALPAEGETVSLGWGADAALPVVEDAETVSQGAPG